MRAPTASRSISPRAPTSTAISTVKRAATAVPGKMTARMFPSSGPSPMEHDLGPSLFPTQHLKDLLAKIAEGRTFYETTIFDGSEDGSKVMTTTVIVGRQATLGADDPEHDLLEAGGRHDLLARRHCLFRSRGRRCHGRGDAHPIASPSSSKRKRHQPRPCHGLWRFRHCRPTGRNWSHSTAWKIAASRFSTSAVTRLSLRKLTFANRRNLLPYSAQVSAEKNFGGVRCDIGVATGVVRVWRAWRRLVLSLPPLHKHPSRLSKAGSSRPKASTGSTSAMTVFPTTPRPARLPSSSWNSPSSSFDLPGDVSDEEPDSVDMRYGLTFPSLVFDGLEADGDYYVADRIRADELLIDFQIESENQGTSSTTGSYDGLAAFALRWARLPDIEEDPARPISRFYPLVAALVDVSFEANGIWGRSTSCPRPPSRP